MLLHCSQHRRPICRHQAEAERALILIQEYKNILPRQPKLRPSSEMERHRYKHAVQIQARNHFIAKIESRDKSSHEPKLIHPVSQYLSDPNVRCSINFGDYSTRIDNETGVLPIDGESTLLNPQFEVSKAYVS